ncbi:hypothetical protein AYL99_03200 [Fonsecaea erecta]|uniref:Uncharacterized protein n=1 Tax=Fonsecaea erecta TaxID=1367422 RepID=A0A178ZXG5_9EURO|nr:hypothetical protein AYL99_03200 [Fonsecaea erecta]OAP63973.1 hypothetical protein AYL99_03200 [Fonsecaea erecta]
MWGKLLSVFKGKSPEGHASRPPNQRHSSTPADPFGDDVAEDEEESTPPSSENRDDSVVRIHHSLERALGRDSRDEDTLDAEDDDDNVPLRQRKTLEEDIELARELSQELQRQSDELTRRSRTNERVSASTDKSA